MAHHKTGTCWNVTYQGETITVTVIDHVDDGYNLSEETMINLTCAGLLILRSNPFADAYRSNNQTGQGVVDGTAVQVPNLLCGLE